MDNNSKEDYERNYWTKALTVKHWPDRKTDSHKGDHGKVGIIAGSNLMPGAAALCAGAAVKSGAGLTSVNIVRSAIPVVTPHVPEATFYDREAELKGFFVSKDAVAVGPGIGTNTPGKEIVIDLIANFNGPLIIDADGLYELDKMLPLIKNRKAPLIITPHTGEMGRLMECPSEYINENRFEVSGHFAEKYGVYVVLKGYETVVAEPNGKFWVNETGNAGLAKGGSGDVLTGMILAFVARYSDIQSAVSSAVFMHGYTADYLLDSGTAIESMTASQVIDTLSDAFTAIKNNEW